MRNIEDPSFSKMLDDDNFLGLIVRTIHVAYIRICEAALSHTHSYVSRVVQTQPWAERFGYDM